MGDVPNITIEEYLNSLFINYTVPQNVIDAILAKREIPTGSLAFQRDSSGKESASWVRQRELAMADLYFTFGTILAGGGDSKQMGNRRIVKMNITIAAADREYWRSLAFAYYRKHGEDFPQETDIYDGGFFWGSQQKPSW